ncbi:MAG: DNA polymerase III subunit gamma/tau [Alteromonadaceae bacterium]|nr:DNA polymerase III subunit gamma/tau [Alteromonadaceae bacterium]
MSYQVLARKWRPRTFEDMVGQEHVLQALVHALEHERLHHAYLFTGTRGVGKTTIGRLLARCLNCETGITPNPCGECDSCREILEGRFVDLIEIDAASRTGVDDMRELTDNVQYSPTRGRYKVYLIDEVHMLTNQSFNAFLKTLEEPPEHVKFLLATTDPQKLPVTVLSRCLQFNLKRMTPEHIVGHLRHVLTEETIPFEDPALWLLARAADGSMRDALSLTDQAIAFGNETLSASDVSNMLGTIDQRDIERIVHALVERDGPGLLAEIQRISEFAPDYSVILSDMLSLFHRVTMEQVVPGSADNAMGDAAQVQTLARQLSAEDAQLFYQTALIGRKDLAVTPDARMGFEMTLLRMLAFRPGTDRREPPAVSSVNHGRESGADAESDPAPSPVPQPSPEPPANPEPEPAMPESGPEPTPEMDPPPWDTGPETAPPVPEQPVAVEPEPAPPPVSEPEPAAKFEPRPEPAPQPDPEPASVSVPQAAEAAGPAPAQNDGEFVWERDFRQLGIKGMPGNLAGHSSMRRDGDSIHLTMDEGHARLLNARHEEKILGALRSYFGDSIKLNIERGDAGPNTPAAYEERQRQARQQAAEESIRKDPLVQRIVEQFEGRVVEDSIRPADSGRR